VPEPDTASPPPAELSSPSTHGDAALLPDLWRRALYGLVPLAVIGIAALGRHYAGEHRPGGLDDVIDSTLIPLGEAHFRPLVALTLFGTPPLLVLGVVVLAITARRARRPRSALLLTVAGPVLASLLTEGVLKPIVGRTHEGELSLPSGHATSISAQVTVFLVVFVAVRLPARAWLRRALVVLGLLLTAGVSLSMVALESHYATDTMAGMLVGPCAVGALALVLDRLDRGRRPARS
jgi:membrane-associated phospholipid phosphatase